MSVERTLLGTVVEIGNALSDPNRTRALAALREGELCVCQLIELLKLAPSTVSKHMTILKQAGLVESRKDSRWVYYRLKGHGRTSVTGRFMTAALSALGSDPRIQDDDAVLRKIRHTDTETICRGQRKRGRDKA